ncbi:MAG: hypothetical protein AAGF11_23290 [Myxococcota bacterium]
MSNYFSSFTPEGMSRLADMLRANEDARREFCQDNRQQTHQMMERMRSERHHAGRMAANERAQFMHDLRTEGRQFRERCAAAHHERNEQSRERAHQYRAAADAFHRARRAQRA